MHILTPRLVDFSNTTLISSHKSRRQIFRLAENQFLILCKDEPNIMLAVESEEMQEVISNLGSEIIDAEIASIRPLICREHLRLGGQELEVRLHLERGDTVVIHSHFGVSII